MSAESRQPNVIRGRGSRGRYQSGQRGFPGGPSHHSPDDYAGLMTDQNAPCYGSRRHGRGFLPHSGRTLWDPNSRQMQDLERQCTYLRFVLVRESRTRVSPEELEQKETFRMHLEQVVRNLLHDYAKENTIKFDPENVKLKCYGSLASGFAVAGSDMDLLLMFPKDEGSVGDIESLSRRMIEKELLNRGYGARLLTKTRVPILRVCQSPQPKLLANLRLEREKWEQEIREAERDAQLSSAGLDPGRLPSTPTQEQSEVATVAFAELDTEPAIMPLPPSPVRSHAELEFQNEVGIQCDINFSNHVAIHNTALLRCYCKCDSRVRPLGLFVKQWAKIRKINSPYYGTLSSYGYIMMVLHYLMNIAQPPVIPNLQHLAKDEDEWNKKTDVELFEGYDIRFVRDEALLETRARAGQITKNRESLESLLRGFFQYYTDPRGFHWLNEVISIRSQGGVLTKASKNWTATSRAASDSSIRLRYILAIEDPFEIEHNIARTVCHLGVRVIRDEFKRAWHSLSTVSLMDGQWVWRPPYSHYSEDLMKLAADRGDLLRKDLDQFRERRKMRQTIERGDPTTRSGGVQNNVTAETKRGNGMSLKSPQARGSHAPLTARSLGMLASKLTKPVGGDQKAGIKRNAKALQASVAKNEGIKKKMMQEGLAKLGKPPGDGGQIILGWIQSLPGCGQNKPQSESRITETADCPTAAHDVPTHCVKPGTAISKKSNALSVFTASQSGKNLSENAGVTTTELGHSLGDCVVPLDMTLQSQMPSNCCGTRKIRRSSDGVVSEGYADVNRLPSFLTARSSRSRRHTISVVEGQFDRSPHLASSQSQKDQVDSGQPGCNNCAEMSKTHKGAVTSVTDNSVHAILEHSAPCGPAEKGHLSQSLKGGKILSNSNYTLALSSNDPDIMHEEESNFDAGELAVPVKQCTKDPAPARSCGDFIALLSKNMHFDPAQIRDLDTIFKGGNGCARYDE